MTTFESIIAGGCPVDVSREPNAPRWPIKSMAIGASFAVALEDEKALRAAAAHANKGGSVKVSVRKASDAVWCIRLA